MDDIEYLDGNITYVQTGLTTVSIGVEAMKRLDRANQTVFDLQVSCNWRTRLWCALLKKHVA